jgi:adenylate cyclase
MADARTHRRLAAILAADVVGFSRLMADDEAGTLASLKCYRDEVFDPLVAAHNGRIIKLIGDGTLVEFGSVVDAVNCALAVQSFPPPASGANGRRPIVLRIGINLGDVIVEGDDIYGDGVNIAARLEPLADPGGICISSIVNESVGNRASVVFEDAGDAHVKNIERPIRLWKWRPTGAPSAGIATMATQQAIPSIAVLPFINLSADAEQEYFSDGITEDIITDLSKIAGLLVIARNSSFAYKGKSVDIRTVGRELGVRSVLEGSVRRAGNRVRITAQLVDAETGGHLWADRYDRDLTDIFAVQDEVTREIVGALKITLTPTDKARIAESGTDNVEAHDLFLRGRELLMGPKKDRAVFERADELFRQAIERDPSYSEAYAGLAWLQEMDHHNRWSAEPERSLERAAQLADQAIECGPKEPFAHCVAGVISLFRGNLERARAEAETALALSPNYALAHNVLAIADLYAGDPLAAVPRMERAIRLDPAFSHQYLHFLGTAYLVAGKYETAATILRERVLLVPETDLSRAFLAAALGQIGEIEEARRVWRELMTLNPAYSFERHIGRLPFRRPADVARIYDGLSKARLLD